MNKKILFVGAINLNSKPNGGAEAKNQILLKRLIRDNKEHLTYVDVSIKKPNTLISLLLKILLCERIILSVASTALNKISFLNYILDKKRITIFVIGGVVHKKLDNNRLLRLFENAEIVYAETEELKNNIKKVSSKIDVQYLPNFKRVPNIDTTVKEIIDEVRLVYLSRIHTDKGIFRSFKLLEHLNSRDSNRKYHLDVYGNFDLSKKEKNKFDKKVNENELIEYRGFLNLNNRKGYELLSSYHFFIFLTEHPGEGFPGVLIDAMIAGVPIIASDWRYNKEILKKDNIDFGLIVKLDELYLNTLVKNIIRLIDEPVMYQELINQMKNEAKRYDIDTINYRIG